jgi:hypothetical protein
LKYSGIQLAAGVFRSALADFRRSATARGHVMSTNQVDRRPLEEPLSELERQFITAYLTASGHDYHALLARDDDAARMLLAEAARYASEKLSEIESRSRYLHNLHGEP